MACAYSNCTFQQAHRAMQQTEQCNEYSSPSCFEVSNIQQWLGSLDWELRLWPWTCRFYPEGGGKSAVIGITRELPLRMRCVRVLKREAMWLVKDIRNNLLHHRFQRRWNVNKWSLSGCEREALAIGRQSGCGRKPVLVIAGIIFVDRCQWSQIFQTEPWRKCCHPLSRILSGDQQNQKRTVVPQNKLNSTILRLKRLAIGSWLPVNSLVSVQVQHMSRHGTKIHLGGTSYLDPSHTGSWLLSCSSSDLQ